MAAAATIPNGRYDAHARRRTVRRGRERGCWLYIPMEELLNAGIAPADPPPFYRVWGRARGSLVARLYRTP